MANPTAEDKEFIEAMESFISFIMRVMVEFSWYRIYFDKFFSCSLLYIAC